MLTRCPQCQTTFRVSQAHLDAANGMVRCGKCQHIFNAQQHISQPADENQPTPAEQPDATTPPPAPQVDWLHDTSAEELEHIDLGQSEPGAEQELAEPSYDFADVSPLDEDTGLESKETPAVEPETEITTSSSLPGGVIIDEGQDQNGPMQLEGIEPAYEDDRHLNYRDEQGLDDLQGEIQRQLQDSEAESIDISSRTDIEPEVEVEVSLYEPEETAEDEPETKATEDAYESVLGYLEEEETHPRHKQSAVENIELASVPTEGPGTVNWNDDVHHDPEIPAALRSSMQALEKRKRRPLMTALMSLLVLVLIAGLGLQVIVFRSHDIATRWPQSRPLLTQICQQLPCVYSGPREPRKIQLVNRDVRVHPSAKHALLISATVVNQAGYAQPYPRLAIKLSDLAGEVVAERVFTPEEYLKQGESRLKLMRPDVPTLISLAVMDPGSEAVNFEFRFL